MTKQDVLVMHSEMQGLLGNLKGVKFCYAIAKNLKKLKVEVDNIADSMKMSKEYKEFDGKRMELVKQHGKKDANGKPIMTPDGRQFEIEFQAAFDADWKKLKDENPHLVAERDTQIEEYAELLKEEYDIEFHKIKQKDIPADITSTQMNIISELIIDAEE